MSQFGQIALTGSSPYPLQTSGYNRLLLWANSEFSISDNEGESSDDKSQQRFVNQPNTSGDYNQLIISGNLPQTVWINSGGIVAVNYILS